MCCVADCDLWGVVEEEERLVWAEDEVSCYIQRCIKIFVSYNQKLLDDKLGSMTPD